MATGVEVVGLILAVLPLLIEAVSCYKSGLDKTKLVIGLSMKSKKRLAFKIEQLAWRLKAQRVHFRSDLTKLFQLSDPDGDFGSLPCDYNHALWYGEMRTKVEAHLCRSGPDVFDAFLGTVMLYKSYLEEIAGYLKRISRPKGTNKRDLKALLEGNPKRGDTYDFRSRVAFVMDEKDIDKLIVELNETTLSIRRFVTTSEDLEQIGARTSHTSQRSHSRTARFLHTIRDHADALFNALFWGWKADCHLAHDTMLCLDGRCSYTHGSKTESKGSVVFQILLSLQPLQTSPVSWQEAIVTTADMDATCPVSSGDTTSVPSLVVGHDPMAQIIYEEIDGICNMISQARRSQSLALQLSCNRRLTRLSEPLCSGRTCIPQRSDTLSLEWFVNHRKLMEPYKRIHLAVTLASSLLQLNGTPWMRSYWTKRSIFFFQDNRAASGIDSDHPLIVEKFSGDAPAATSQSSDSNPERVLLELGIVLLEIHRRLSFEFCLSSGYIPGLNQDTDLQDPDMRRLYSIKWFDQEKDNLEPDYLGVVSECLKQRCFDSVMISWEVEDFRNAYYTNIIYPLIALELARVQ